MPPQAPQAAPLDPFAEFVVEGDDPFAAFAETAPPEEEPTGAEIPGASATMGALRAGAAVAPMAGRSLARFAANHPAGTQKTIGAGMTALASGVGGAIGSVFGPTGTIAGALGGGMIRGLTPTQANIREWAGRGMGEAKDVAKEAGRAVGIQEYIKSTSGLKVPASDILERAKGLPAAENYAKAQGRELLKILGPDGSVVRGPTAPAIPKAPSLGGRLVTGGAGVAKRGLSAASKVLGAVSGPIAMTDLAQTLEPTRTDIGVMGIGASQPDPSGEALAQIDARNKQQMEARLAAQQAQRERIREAILSGLGLR